MGAAILPWPRRGESTAGCVGYGGGRVARLSTSDAAFFHQEDTATPMYVGSLAILPPARRKPSYEALLATVEQRLRRSRGTGMVRRTRVGLAGVGSTIPTSTSPITSAARRCRSPGSDAQLYDLISRLAGPSAGPRPPTVGDVSDRGAGGGTDSGSTSSHTRLWSTGCRRSKSGTSSAICSRRPATPVEDIWLPRGEPSDGQLMIDAGDWLARPGHELQALRSTVAALW